MLFTISIIFCLVSFSQGYPETTTEKTLTLNAEPPIQALKPQENNSGSERSFGRPDFLQYPGNAQFPGNQQFPPNQPQFPVNTGDRKGAKIPANGQGKHFVSGPGGFPGGFPGHSSFPPYNPGFPPMPMFPPMMNTYPQPFPGSYPGPSQYPAPIPPFMGYYPPYNPYGGFNNNNNFYDTLDITRNAKPVY